ncbi:MAG TPA: hydroxyacid dehydrogenase [Opitutaceae bacterium]|nr:hydroxyacid dehydrogenase [Opitutaceae bacterium]
MFPPESTVASLGRRPKSALILAPETALLLYGEAGLAEIRSASELVVTIDDPSSLAARPAILAEVEVLFTGWGCPRIDGSVLAAAPQLRAVFFAGGTLRYWISDAVWERGLIVVGAYSVNAIPVAEFTLAAVLLSLKRTWHYLGQHKSTAAYPLPKVPSPGAHHSTVGLIGLGEIGRLVRERLRPFELDILAFDPYADTTVAKELGVTLASLEEVFRRSDVVSLHAPHLPSTEGMITGAHLASMRPGATFINTARGQIVREAEMAEVLRAREDLTALLDVLAEEPPAPDNPLLGLPNVFITPHIAGSLDRECLRMGELVLAEFARWVRGEPLRHQITREKAATLA